MQGALPGNDIGVPVFFRHRSKYGLRGYPLLGCNASLHHVAQEPTVGGDAIRLLNQNRPQQKREERVGGSAFMAEKSTTSITGTTLAET